MGKASSYNLDTDGTTWTLEDLYKPIVRVQRKVWGWLILITKHIFFIEEWIQSMMS